MKRCLQLILGFVFATAPAFAQEPYSTLSTGLSLGYAAAPGDFQDTWRMSPAASLSAQTPFRYGWLEIGAGALRNTDTLEDGERDFTAALLFAGWGPSVNIGRRLDWRSFGIAGDFLMLFDEGADGYSRRENELALGLRSSFVVTLTRHMEMEAGFTAFRVFTSRPLDFVLLSGGIRYRLTTPSWARELMR